ncbi:MAG: alpha-amylase family glycosyl hydrolase [cyanobacterium endosymbiont of Rhopalodia sterrenbergii]
MLLLAYDGDLLINYISWINYRVLLHLNHNNPAVRKYIMQVEEYLLHYSIDGWHLDTPDCVKLVYIDDQYIEIVRM